MNKKIYKASLCVIGAHMLVGSSFIPMQDTYISYAQERVDEKNIKPRNSQVMSVVSEVLNEYGLEEIYSEVFLII